MYQMMDGLWHGWNMYSWLLLAVLVAGVAVLVVRGKRPGTRDDSAMNVLRRRYAAGEIDDEELEHRLSLLQSRSRQKDAPNS